MVFPTGARLQSPVFSNLRCHGVSTCVGCDLSEFHSQLFDLYLYQRILSDDGFIYLGTFAFHLGKREKSYSSFVFWAIGSASFPSAGSLNLYVP